MFIASFRLNLENEHISVDTNLRSGYQSVGVIWNWVSVPGVFVELASQGFFTFERCFVRNPCDRIESILDVNTARSAPGKPHTACRQKVEGGCLWIRGATLDVQSLLTTACHHATMNAFLRGLLPMLRRSTVRVSSSTARDCSSAASRVCDRCWQVSLWPFDIT